MNVNIPARLDGHIHDSLKEFAKEHKESVSLLMTKAMQDVVEGRLTLTKPCAEPKKKTSLSVHYEVAVRFKEKLKESGIAMETAIEQLAELIVHTAH